MEIIIQKCIQLNASQVQTKIINIKYKLNLMKILLMRKNQKLN